MHCLVIPRSTGLIKLMLKQQELLASKLGPDLPWEEPQQLSVAITVAAVISALTALGGSPMVQPNRCQPHAHTLPQHLLGDTTTAPLTYAGRVHCLSIATLCP